MANYPGDSIANFVGQKTSVNMPTVENFEEAFITIPTYGDDIRIDTDGTFDNVRAYKEFTLSKLKKERRTTHFQGVIRSYVSNHMYLSGGDKKNKSSQLFVIKLSSYLQNITVSSQDIISGPIGSNVILQDRPPIIDTLRQVLILDDDQEYWHAGGMGLCGDILAIPIENNTKNKSKIKFYKTLKDGSIRFLGDKLTIEDDINNNGAVSLIRLQNGRYLCLTWTDSNKYDAKNRRFRFYLSKTKNFLDGFKLESGKFNYYDYPYIAIHTGRQPQYQGIQLVQQKGGRLFFIGAENSSAFSPAIKGKNRLRSYEVHLTYSKAGKKNISGIAINKVLANTYPDGKIFNNGKKQYNFDAGCSFHFTPNGHLSLYATHHWKNNGFINLSEFHYNKSNDTINHIDHSIIELYEKTNYKGRCLRIYGKKNSLIRNYKNININNKHFNKKTQSIRCKIAIGHSYELFSNKDFDSSKNMLTLEGQGSWINIDDVNKIKKSDRSKGIKLKDLTIKFGKTNSSSRYS